MDEFDEKQGEPEDIEKVNVSNDIESLKKIEAALFVAGKWLSLQELITLTDVNPISIKDMLQILCKKYAENPGAIEILEKENLWKMDVKPQYLNMVNKLATGTSEFTRAEQETLAVIAYKQPVKQSLIIRIRGNKAYDHVKKFIQLGLVKAKRMGHTKELNLSEEFYEYFHVGNSDEVSEHARNSDDKEEFRHIGKEENEKTEIEKNEKEGG